jgi:hypothetical protein
MIFAELALTPQDQELFFAFVRARSFGSARWRFAGRLTFEQIF